MSVLIRDKAFYKKALSIMVPVTAQQIITMGVTVMDNIMVGQLEETAISGVSAATQIFELFHFMILGLALGGNILTARFWGAKNRDGMNKAITLNYRFGLLLALLFTLVCAITPRGIVSLYSSEADVIAEGIRYLKFSLPCFFLVACCTVTTTTLRNIKQIKVPLYTSIGAFFINIFFNWMFIFGKLGAPAMGVAGAALGTVISRIFEFVVMVGFLLFKDKNLQYDARNLVRLPCRDLMHEYLKISIPVMVSDTLLGLGSSVTVSIIGHMNKIYMSAYSITAMVQRLSNVFMVGMSQASTLIIGHTLGEGNPEKAKKQGITMALLAACIGAVCSVIILVAGPFIISHYNITDETKEIAWGFMSAVAVFSVFLYEAGVLTKGVLRGGGDTRFLMIADVLFLWVLCVPLGYLAAHVWHWPPFFLFMALRVDHIMKIVLCLPRLLSGKWMKKIKVK